MELGMEPDMTDNNFDIFYGSYKIIIRRPIFSFWDAIINIRTEETPLNKDSEDSESSESSEDPGASGSPDKNKNKDIWIHLLLEDNIKIDREDMRMLNERIFSEIDIYSRNILRDIVENVNIVCIFHHVSSNVLDVNRHRISDENELPFITLTLNMDLISEINSINTSLSPNVEITNIANIKKSSKNKIKNIVWTRYGNVNSNNQNEGKCFCCNKILLRSEVSTHFGHIIPKSKGGKYTVENIRPICIMCNTGAGGMHTMHMYEYIIKKNLYGLKYLSEEDKKLYVYDFNAKKILLEKCYIKLGILLNENVVDKHTYDRFNNILKTQEAITKDFQAVIRYIDTFN